MADPGKTLATQLENLQKRSGKTLHELYAVIRKSGLGKHGEIRDMLKRDLDMGHGDANTVVHFYLKEQGGGLTDGAGAPGNPLDRIYSGAKAELRPIHDRVMAAVEAFGPFEAAPKKAYVSLRRKKQFATLGPPAKNRVEVGLNMKGVAGTERLLALPPGGMCQYKVNLTDPDEVDAELIGWIRQAYDAAG